MESLTSRPGGISAPPRVSFSVQALSEQSEVDQFRPQYPPKQVR
jgi:hypothetical protein